MIQTIFNNIRRIFEVPYPPYPYNFLMDLDEKEYPKYIKQIYRAATGRKLNLKNPKRFSEKIQWLKLYDNLPIKTTLTDKILVRDWIEEKIGSEYLKPIISINNTYDEIDFTNFPDCFIIKANHGCKWHYKIKNKAKFLESEALQEIIKRQLNDWLSISFFPFAGLETQYKNIVPKLISEPLLLDNPQDKADEIEIYCFNSNPKILNWHYNDLNTEIRKSCSYDEKFNIIDLKFITNYISVEHPLDENEIYCFNGKPKIFQHIKYTNPRQVSIYDENFNNIDLKFLPNYELQNKPVDDCIRQAVELSKKLCLDFKLVRVDWLIYKDKIYFNEMTFTPFSGLYNFEDDSWDYRLGNMLNLKN